MLKFTTHSMLYITDVLEKKITNLAREEILEFEVLNPDICDSVYAGNIVQVNDILYLYRSYKAWVDLASLLHCKILTPLLKEKNLSIIRYKKLKEDQSFHHQKCSIEEKYGKDSIFSQIHKMEEPSFFHYFKQALKNVDLNKRTRILNLGINNADEFESIKEFASNFENLELVGIDYCESAIKVAQLKLSAFENIKFYSHDINELSSLNLGTFDLILSIGTLQSSNLEYKSLLMSKVQNHLNPYGSMILGFPNCRWIDGEIIYGARPKNYSFSEMSLIYNDVVFAKKYLQQKQFRVTVTGKEYIFVTATSIRKELPN